MTTIESASFESQVGGLRRAAKPIRGIWTHRRLIRTLCAREFAQQYRASSLGVVWALAGPLLQLSVYALVFGILFAPRFGTGERAMYVLDLYCGIIVFGVFSEVVSRSPSLVVQKQNLVTKIAFPLEVLPISALWTAAVPAMIGAGLLLVGVAIVTGSVPLTAPLAIVTLFPLVMLTIGLAWALSALGVYIRDTQHAIRSTIQLLFFLTPIVWQVELLPEHLRQWVYLNPLAVMLEWTRGALIHGEIREPVMMLLVCGYSMVIAIFGAWLFQTLRRGFADVV